LLYKWKREFKRKDESQGEKETLKQLLKENRELKEERDILKKALAIFSKVHGKGTGL
jgi:transposase-like protein